MAQTKTSLANLALMHLGGGPPFFTDIDTDTTKEGKLFIQCLDNSRLAVLRAHPWNFAIDRVSLALKAITNCVNSGAGLIRVTAVGHGLSTGNFVTVASVQGTSEANGQWTVTLVDANTVDLQASTFTNTYVSGGVIGLASAYEFQFKQALPTGFVRLVSIEDDPEFEVEGAYIVTDSQTLKIKFVKDVFSGITNYASMDPQFFQALSLHLAWSACYAITQSNKLRMEIWESLQQVIGRARHVDSTESPAKQFTADEWDFARISSGGRVKWDRNYRD